MSCLQEKTTPAPSETMDAFCAGVKETLVNLELVIQTTRVRLSSPLLGTGRKASTSAPVATTCAVLDNGSVMCWGRDNYGQIGDGFGRSASPTHTVGLPRPAVAVEVGMDFSCALLDNGSVMCWGRGSGGRLGNGGTSNSAQPVYTDPMPAVERRGH